MNTELKILPKHFLDTRMAELCQSIKENAESFFWGENNEEIPVKNVYWNCTLMSIQFETDNKVYLFGLDEEIRLKRKNSESVFYFDR